MNLATYRELLYQLRCKCEESATPRTTTQLAKQATIYYALLSRSAQNESIMRTCSSIYIFKTSGCISMKIAIANLY
jgi:hypothetical protein